MALLEAQNAALEAHSLTLDTCVDALVSLAERAIEAAGALRALQDELEALAAGARAAAAAAAAEPEEAAAARHPLAAAAPSAAPAVLHAAQAAEGTSPLQTGGPRQPQAPASDHELRLMAGGGHISGAETDSPVATRPPGDAAQPPGDSARPISSSHRRW